MTMKKLLYIPLLITLLASLIFGALPFGQPSIVYAAPATLTLLPDGSGNYTNIEDVEPAGTQHWDAVNDLVGSPDDITTYIYTNSAIQQKDAYTLQDTTQTGPINSVTVYFRGRSSKSSKTHYFQPFLRLSDNETSGTEIVVDTDTWTTYNQIFTDKPGGGSWTWTDINNLQVAIGLRELETGEPQLTQIYVEVDYNPPNILNTPGNYDFDILSENTTANTTLTYFEVTNNSGFAVNITIGGTDMIGGVTWTLDDDATPGEDTYGLKAGLAGGSYNITVMKTGPYNILVGGLAGGGGTQSWGLKLWAPTSFTGGGTVSGNVTLTATQV